MNRRAYLQVGELLPSVELYGCFTARADALFDLADAVLCTDGT